LHEWEELIERGLASWDPARERGLPDYDHPRDDLRGGIDKYIPDLRDTADGAYTPWKAFFIKWVAPEIDKQSSKVPKASPGRKYTLDMADALDKATAHMLEEAGINPAGVTARCACATAPANARCVRRGHEDGESDVLLRHALLLAVRGCCCLGARHALTTALAGGRRTRAGRNRARTRRSRSGWPRCGGGTG
jgi:hypothetical protein